MASISVVVRNSLSSYSAFNLYSLTANGEIVPEGRATQISIEAGDLIVLSGDDVAGPFSTSEFYATTSSGIYDVTPRKYYPNIGNNLSTFLVIKANQSGEIDVVYRPSY